MAYFQNNCQVYQTIEISQLSEALNLWDPTLAVPTGCIVHTLVTSMIKHIQTSSWTKPVRNSKLISVHVSSSLASGTGLELS